jgi:hypothetical protein
MGRSGRLHLTDLLSSVVTAAAAAARAPYGSQLISFTPDAARDITAFGSAR